MVPPSEYGLGYLSRNKVQPYRNPNPNPNPKLTLTLTNPKSKNNVCSTKWHRNKVQHSVIYINYFPREGLGLLKAYNHEAGTTDDLSGTREQNRGLGGVSK